MSYFEYPLNMGQLKVSDSFQIKAKNTVPFPTLEIIATIGYEPKRTPQSFLDPRVKLNPTALTGYFVSEAIFQSYIDFTDIEPYYSKVHSWSAQLPLEAISHIEGKRVDDVELSFILTGHCLEYDGNGRSAQPQRTQETRSFSLGMRKKFSQKDWAQLLSDLGYNRRWIVEIDAPQLENFAGIDTLLGKAWQQIHVSFDAEGAMENLRTVWNKVDPLLAQYWSTISDQINTGSVGEPNFPQKDRRVQDISQGLKDYFSSLKDLSSKTRTWTNIGPHKESYVVTINDALLAYRITVSLLSYLSRLIGSRSI